MDSCFQSSFKFMFKKTTVTSQSNFLRSIATSSCQRHGEGTTVNKTESIRVWLQQIKTYVNNFATASLAKVGGQVFDFPATISNKFRESTSKQGRPE
jgi:hypothetical protein